MTTYLDYSATPGDNNSPPPVGAPEGMFPSSVNDTMREMMSVVRQLGDQVTSTFAGLGDMAKQNSTGVSITGGNVTATLAGNGAGITNLNASNLTTGTVSASLLSGYYNINVAHATNADELGGITLASLVPVGSIIMFMGNLASVDMSRWALCDGTRGTPNMVGRFPLGTNNAGALVPGGASNSVTDAQGWHSHGGGTEGHQLTVAEMPGHQHNIQLGWSYMNNPGPSGRPAGTTQFAGNSNTLTDWAGNNNAHSHVIDGDGNHQHNVTVNPPNYGLYFLMRIA